jgi:hypothetical protein
MHNPIDLELKNHLVYCPGCGQYAFSESPACSACGRSYMTPGDLAVRHIDRFYLALCILAALACAVLMVLLNGLVPLLLTGVAALVLCLFFYFLKPPLSRLHEKSLVQRVFASKRTSQTRQMMLDTVNRLEIALTENNIPVFEKMLSEQPYLRALDSVGYLETLCAYKKGEPQLAWTRCRSALLADKGNLRYVDLTSRLVSDGFKPDVPMAQALGIFANDLDHPQHTALLTALVQAEYDSPTANMRFLELAIKYTGNVWFRLKRFYALACQEDPTALQAAYQMGMALFDSFKNDRTFLEALVGVIKRTGALDAASSAVVNHYYSTL